MRISLIAIGRLKSGPESELFERYLDRARKSGPQVGLEIGQLIEHPESRQATALLRQKEEAQKILSSMEPDSLLFCLDEKGEQLTSTSFTKRICGLRDEGTPGISFVIGGPDGLSDLVRSKAKSLIAFGKFTYPHMLMRILLMEQLYRSITIALGHPYHRE